jgi:putative DNA primase/helicase
VSKALQILDQRIQAMGGSVVVTQSLEEAAEPPKPESRYKLLGSAEIAALPPLVWRLRGVLPAVGLAAMFGPSGCGKSFLALDMAAAIAEGCRWFDCRVQAAPVVYAAESAGGEEYDDAMWTGACRQGAAIGSVLPENLTKRLQR